MSRPPILWTTSTHEVVAPGKVVIFSFFRGVLDDLGVYPARDLLRDLQGRDVLRKIDETSSGPGVRYGPGPGFPTRRSGRSHRTQR